MTANATTHNANGLYHLKYIKHEEHLFWVPNALQLHTLFVLQNPYSIISYTKAQ